MVHSPFPRELVDNFPPLVDDDVILVLSSCSHVVKAGVVVRLLAEMNGFCLTCFSKETL